MGGRKTVFSTGCGQKRKTYIYIYIYLFNNNNILIIIVLGIMIRIIIAITSPNCNENITKCSFSGETGGFVLLGQEGMRVSPLGGGG